MKELIINELLKLSVICEERLIEYVDFCVKYNTVYEKFKTESHHILPKSLFPSFKDLKVNQWNCANLTHKNHYIAHSLLAEAIDDPLIIFAWGRMNIQNLNKDENKYAELRQKHSKYISKLMSEVHSNKVMSRSLSTNKVSKVSLEELENDDDLIHDRKGKIPVTNGQTTLFVDCNNIPDGFYHIRKGIQHSLKSKQLISNNCNNSKENNPMAKTYEIYDSSDNLISTCKGNLRETANNLGISFSSIQKALKEYNGVLFSNAKRKSDIALLKKNGSFKYIGWYIKDLGKIN